MNCQLREGLKNATKPYGRPGITGKFLVTHPKSSNSNPQSSVFVLKTPGLEGSSPSLPVRRYIHRTPVYSYYLALFCSKVLRPLQNVSNWRRRWTRTVNFKGKRRQGLFNLWEDKYQFFGFPVVWSFKSSAKDPECNMYSYDWVMWAPDLLWGICESSIIFPECVKAWVTLAIINHSFVPR